MRETDKGGEQEKKVEWGRKREGGRERNRDRERKRNRDKRCCWPCWPIFSISGTQCLSSPIIAPFSAVLANFLHLKLHPEDRFSWAAGQSTPYLRPHASKVIGSVPATRIQIWCLSSPILASFSAVLANFLHFKLHPEDRFSWMAGQSTHNLSNNRSKAIGSVPATGVQIWCLSSPILAPFFCVLANFLHLKLHPEDRFSWAASQSTQNLRPHASKVIGSVPIAWVHI